MQDIITTAQYLNQKLDEQCDLYVELLSPIAEAYRSKETLNQEEIDWLEKYDNLIETLEKLRKEDERNNISRGEGNPTFPLDLRS